MPQFTILQSAPMLTADLKLQTASRKSAAIKLDGDATKLLNQVSNLTKRQSTKVSVIFPILPNTKS